MTVEFTYLQDGTLRTGLWHGDPAEALSAAVEYLGAEYSPEDDAWTYQARETGEDYVLDEHELIRAGAAILAGAEDWYSLWCAESGAPVGR